MHFCGIFAIIDIAERKVRSSKDVRKYPTVKKEYNSCLSDWGPYSKTHAGITAIENGDDADRVEFSVFPGYFRGPITTPCELWQGNHYPWYARSDLRFYTYRFELEWKDRVYADVSYLVKSDNEVIVRASLTNATEMPQNLCLHALAERAFVNIPTVVGAEKTIDPLAYDSIGIKSDDPREGLCPDGKLRGEIIRNGFCFGHALGSPFGGAEGDTASYTLPDCNADTLFVRARGNCRLRFDGAAVGEITVSGDESAFYDLPLCGGTELSVTVVSPGKIEIDALALGTGGSLPHISGSDKKVRPTLEKRDGSVRIAYNGMKNVYAIAWNTEGCVREFLTSDIDRLMPYSVQNHVSSVIGRDGDRQYTDVFIKPIPIEPFSTVGLSLLICRGTADAVDEMLSAFGAEPTAEPPQIPADTDRYSLGQRLMRAAMLTNVVYPIPLQGNYIRHFTPGKWWDSLYTWDNGFIALGFCDFAPRLAEECLNTYLTDVGNVHAAFVHHGSMLPVQAYVYKRLCDISGGDVGTVGKYYAPMRQYYEFYVGKDSRSRTCRLKSGLLSTFGYFYNSGGWDDYPAQRAVHKTGLASRCSPAVNSAHAINFARVMAHAAALLGLDDSEYLSDIRHFRQLLRDLSYDPDSGYFGYLLHDEDGRPTGILRTDDGENFNMGFDGAYPALVGACDDKERELIIDRIMSKDAMWTEIGMSVVDRSAPYYSSTGYWNGSVWMPHQWFAFLGMLEYGKNEYAAKIAFTALELWKRETDYSYRCCEHFMIDSKRGAGWMCFGALSSPVVMWYTCLFCEGNLTLPVCLRLSSKSSGDGFIRFTAEPCLPEDGYCTVIAVPGGENARVTVNGKDAVADKYGKALFIKLAKNDVSDVGITW